MRNVLRIMRVKGFLLCILCIVSVVSFASVSAATVIVMNDGAYTTPDDWFTISSYAPIDMRHGAYYIVGLPDWALGAGINITFHGIYNENTAPNFLEVWLFDEPAESGWHYAGEDGYSQVIPDWAGEYGATSLGIWEDLDGPATVNDVIFSMNFEENPDLLTSLRNGGLFGIGIDPDCRFFGDEITVDVPVPEPATLMLFGTGLVGLAGLGRKKLFRK